MQRATLREPAVAGMFYPGTPEALERDLTRYIVPDPAPHPLLGCIAPHAGYMYSGPVAGRLYGHLEIPERVIVLGPNHTGIGEAIAVAPHRAWKTPLGEEPVDVELAGLLVEELPGADFDASAHWREHSLEVQIPFLLARNPAVRIVPIVLGFLPLEECLELGATLARVIRRTGEPVGIVASSDMTHYEPDAVARQRDRLAIEAALGLDPSTLYTEVRRHGITMCGVVPATVMLAAVRELGAESAHLVDYATSGDTGGDRSSVVGYAGICVPRTS
ncbi:MAG TPA: AmmeMemoRadiSam system protein B [Acidobacteria bacterium]|nr:AmmeMemoRadiSam system protein B [Acidobacteriota bacterium]